MCNGRVVCVSFVRHATRRVRMRYNLNVSIKFWFRIWGSLLRALGLRKERTRICLQVLCVYALERCSSNF